MPRKQEYKNNPEKAIKDAVAWGKANPAKRWAIRLKHAQGITTEEYIEQWKAQLGVCAICGVPPKNGEKLHVDHDHKCCAPPKKPCGKCFRGLLCGPHNRMIGLAGDDPVILANSIDYLKYGPFKAPLEEQSGNFNQEFERTYRPGQTPVEMPANRDGRNGQDYLDGNCA